MDWGIVMGVITAVLLVAFLGIVVWAYRKERKKAFDEAANYPLFDNEELRL
jgi:cytochrome c oxidase cbb3-type subunit 4